MPGRKKNPLVKLFKDVISASKTLRVKCLFCNAEIAKNGTRMAQHINNCKSCDEQVKTRYFCGAQGEQQQAMLAEEVNTFQESQTCEAVADTSSSHDISITSGGECSTSTALTSTLAKKQKSISSFFQAQASARPLAPAVSSITF